MQVDDYVRVNETEECGRIVKLDDKKATVLIEDRQHTYLLSQLTYLPPMVFDEKVLRNIFRMNIDLPQIINQTGFLDNHICEKPYLPEVQDLKALLLNMKIKQVEYDYYQLWVYTINVLLEDYYLKQTEFSDSDLGQILLEKDGDVFNYVLNDLHHGVFSDEREDDKDKNEIDNLISVVSKYITNKDKKIEEREYDETIKENYILYISDNDKIDSLDDEHQQLFKQFLEELFHKENLIAYEVMGYCCYGGNSLYDCDWDKARDIFEVLYQRTGNTDYANTLGYLYYYGRCNNGAPQYDLAFKYYSIGSAGGNYESTYKLADMFFNGQYVVENKETAKEMYTNLYKENKGLLEKGFFDCKFADIAYRMGQFYLTGEDSQYISALYYFLQARFAIQKRRETENYYGDDKVEKNISDSVEVCKKKIGLKTSKTISVSQPYLLRELLKEDNRVRCEVKHLKNETLKLTFTRLPKKKDELENDCLLTLLDFEGCLLTDKIVLYAKKVEYFKGDDDFILTDYQYDDYQFIFDQFQQETAILACDHFELKNPFKVTKK